jgi:hypothetical protein
MPLVAPLKIPGVAVPFTQPQITAARTQAVINLGDYLKDMETIAVLQGTSILFALQWAMAQFNDKWIMPLADNLDPPTAVPLVPASLVAPNAAPAAEPVVEPAADEPQPTSVTREPGEPI